MNLAFSLIMVPGVPYIVPNNPLTKWLRIMACGASDPLRIDMQRKPSAIPVNCDFGLSRDAVNSSRRYWSMEQMRLSRVHLPSNEAKEHLELRRWPIALPLGLV